MASKKCREWHGKNKSQEKRTDKQARALAERKADKRITKTEARSLRGAW